MSGEGEGPRRGSFSPTCSAGALWKTTTPHVQEAESQRCWGRKTKDTQNQKRKRWLTPHSPSRCEEANTPPGLFSSVRCASLSASEPEVASHRGLWGKKMMAEAACQPNACKQANKPKTKKSKHHALFSAGVVRSHSSHPHFQSAAHHQKYKCTYHDAVCGGEGDAVAAPLSHTRPSKHPGWWLMGNRLTTAKPVPRRILRTPAYSAPFAQCSSPTSFDRSHLMRPLSAYGPATPDRP